jgi:fatty-acyl-CoA synthase
MDRKIPSASQPPAKFAATRRSLRENDKEIRERTMTGRLIQTTKSAYNYPLLIKHLLHAPLQHSADQEIVYRDHRRFTYRMLRERIGRLASALAELGVRPGDTVGVMDWDSHRFLEAFFAVPMMGAVLQTVNIRLSPDQVAYTVDHAGASTLLVNDEFFDLLQQIRPQIPKVKTIVVMTDSDTVVLEEPGIAGRYEEMLAAASPDFDFPDFDENSQATTFYTSGTTGLPKGVYFSHRQMVLHTITELAALGLAPKSGRFDNDSVYMPITPMFHVHAWGLPFAATAAGCKQVYPGRYVPELLLKLIKTEGVSFTHCVPTILMMLLDAPGSAEVDLSGLTMVIGGAALPKSLALRAMERGIDIFAGYGMSETGPMLTLAHLKTPMLSKNHDEQADIRVKTGRPIPLVDIRIVDLDMKDVTHDGQASGEIVVRAPWLTQGYFENPEASEALWRDGYMHTNDVANMNAEGYLQITDRMKDLIKTGGEWISTLQLEDLIMQAPGVKEAAVIAIKDEKWGERPMALVVRDWQAPESPTENDIKSFLGGFVDQGVISKYSVPQSILFVDELERTSVGKLNKQALRQRYAHGA